MKILKAAFCIAVLLFLVPGCYADKEEVVVTVYSAEEIYQYAENAIFYLRILQEDERVSAVGTGFFLSADGEALTAYHVVSEAERMEAILSDGTVISDIEVMAVDEQTDVAFLKLGVKEQKVETPLKLRQDAVRHGEEIFAIGYPLKETAIITRGIINSPKAVINGQNKILVSAEIASGMSGGPILDQRGEVVGMISGSLRTMNNIHLIVKNEDIFHVLAR